MTRFELWARPRDSQRDLPYIRVGVADLVILPDENRLRLWNLQMENIYVWTNVEYELRPAHITDTAPYLGLH